MRSVHLLAATTLMSLIAPVVSAQDRPFVFSITTASDASQPTALVDYGIGVGDSAGWAYAHQLTASTRDRRQIVAFGGYSRAIIVCFEVP